MSIHSIRARNQWAATFRYWKSVGETLLSIFLSAALLAPMVLIAMIGFLTECTWRAFRHGWHTSVAFWDTTSK